MSEANFCGIIWTLLIIVVYQNIKNNIQLTSTVISVQVCGRKNVLKFNFTRLVIAIGKGAAKYSQI